MPDVQHDKCQAALDRLFQAKAWLHTYWRYYVSLYGTSPDRFDVFNKHTGEIFKVFHDCLRHTVILELAKLLGPHKSGGMAQVSIRRAINDMPLPDNHPKKLEWRKRLDGMEAKYQAIVDTRNNLIAHTSMRVATGEETLGGISRAMIAAALADCVELTNDIVLEFKDAEYGFMDFGDEERNVKTLLEILSLGNETWEGHLKEKRKKLYSDSGLRNHLKSSIVS